MADVLVSLGWLVTGIFGSRCSGAGARQSDLPDPLQGLALQQSSRIGDIQRLEPERTNTADDLAIALQNAEPTA